MHQCSLPSSTDAMIERRVCSSADHIDLDDCRSSVKVDHTRIGSHHVQLPHSTALSARELEAKNAQLQRKLSFMEEEKVSLLKENRELISELEAVQLELASFQTKVRVLERTVGSKSCSVSVMKEEIEELEVKVETQNQTLRDAERRLEENQTALGKRTQQVEQLQKQVKAIQADLDQQTKHSACIEKERAKALAEAEKQNLALQQFKSSMSQTVQKMMDSKKELKMSLVLCDQERTELEKRCSLHDQEMDKMSKLISQLKQNSSRADLLAMETAGLRSCLDEVVQRCKELERMEQGGAVERGAQAEEVQVLRGENRELRLLSSQQEERLEECRREMRESRAELSSLEAVFNLLHLRQGGEGLFCTQPCLASPVSPHNTPNLQPGEQYQRLLPVLREVELDRARQADLARGLQQNLEGLQKELASLRSTLTHRDQSLQQLQTQLTYSTTHTSQLEKELKRAAGRLAECERELMEKQAVCSQAVERNQALEQSLLEQSSSAERYQNTLELRSRDLQQALDEAEQLHTHQRQELGEQTQQLQVTSRQKAVKIEELEEALAAMQREKQQALLQVDTLQTSLTQLNQERDSNHATAQQALKELTAQAAQSTAQVKYMEAALAVCRGEQTGRVRQMEEVEARLQRQLQARSRETLQLQCGIQRLQAQLQKSAHHVTELENCEAWLSDQVTRLEEELESERALASAELQKSEQKVLEATLEAERHKKEAAQLSSTVRQLTEDMSKCRGELSERERELLLIRRASGANAAQLAHMQKMLQETKGLMEKKAEKGTDVREDGDSMVHDLQEKVQRSRRDRRNSLHRTQLLETQMKTVQGELVGTLDQLQALRDVLRRSQQNAEERKAAMDRLAAELRETHVELERTRQEVQEKDKALADVQEELRQYVGQTVAVGQEHQRELEQRVLHLQGALERSEREVMDRSSQVEFLSERLELVRAQLEGSKGPEEESEVMQKEAELVRIREPSAEAKLQAAVAKLTHELAAVRRRHEAELLALQESQAEVLRASDCVADMLRSSQELLSRELKISQSELDKAHRNVAALLAQLHSREQLLQDTSKALLHKESEVTRLKTRLSSLERSRGLQSITQHSSSLFTDPEGIDQPLTRLFSKEVTPSVVVGTSGSDEPSYDLHKDQI